MRLLVAALFVIRAFGQAGSTADTYPAGPGRLIPLPLVANECSVSIAAGGSLVSNPAPRYPQSARRRGISGVVVVQAWVGHNGQVTSVEVISGPVALRKASLRAIKRWRWSPTILHGLPVERQAEVRFSYTLRRP